MDIYQKLEKENVGLIEHVKEIEGENQCLNLEVTALRKSLEKQKHLYRKFSNDVVESERIRTDTFKLEKRSLVEENQSLIKENRQLKKDVSFYKDAFKELAKEDEPGQIKSSIHQSPKVAALAVEKESVQAKCLTRTQATTTHESASASTTEHDHSSQMTLQVECKHKSSRALSKTNEKLFVENKKQKMKINSLNATIQLLKTKNRQLDNYKRKMVNKKMKFSQEDDELDRLVESTKLKNKDIFTDEILTKLDELSK